MRIAYIDCFSGISGDMMLSALVDAGADAKWIEQELHKLPISFQLEWRTAMKKGVRALKLDVHDLEQEGHHHGHEHLHEHDHHHGHEHSHHDHHHRGYREIVEMINQASLPDQVKKQALAIFLEIGKAEAKIHDIPLEVVHFHEVGAVDSIVDIIGVALALENLGIQALYASPVPTGNGFVRCEHGLYPVPAPATLEILQGIPLRSTPILRELTTPTGAGIAKALVSQFGPLPNMTVERIGYGAGSRDLEEQPNVLRIIIGTLT